MDALIDALLDTLLYKLIDELFTCNHWWSITNVLFIIYQNKYCVLVTVVSMMHKLFLLQVLYSSMYSRCWLSIPLKTTIIYLKE